MIIKCVECGGMVSDKAATCPHCGAPVLLSLNGTVTETLTSGKCVNDDAKTLSNLEERIKNGITQTLEDLSLQVDRMDDVEWEFARSRVGVYGGDNERKIPWWGFFFDDVKISSFERNLSRNIGIDNVRVGGRWIFVPTLKVQPNFLDTYQRYDLDRRLISVMDNSPSSVASYWQRVSENENRGFLALPVPLGVYFGDGADTKMVPLVDLTDQNVLIGGGAGTGKSSMLHQMICSLAMSRTHSLVQLIMFDLADKEFEPYEELPICEKVIYDAVTAMDTLRECAEESKRRYFDEMNPRCGRNGGGWGCYNVKRLASGLGASPFKVLVIDDLEQLCAAVGEEGVKILQDLSTAWKSGYYILAATRRISRTMKFASFNFQQCYSFKTDDAKQSRLVIGNAAASRIEVYGDFASSRGNGSIDYHRLYIDKAQVREVVDGLLDDDCVASRKEAIKKLELY